MAHTEFKELIRQLTIKAENLWIRAECFKQYLLHHNPELSGDQLEEMAKGAAENPEIRQSAHAALADIFEQLDASGSEVLIQETLKKPEPPGRPN